MESLLYRYLYVERGDGDFDQVARFTVEGDMLFKRSVDDLVAEGNEIKTFHTDDPEMPDVYCPHYDSKAGA